jgi:hypothetical protein
MSRTLLTLAVLVGCVTASPAAQPKKDARAKEVDAAISRALKYLQNNQLADGTWIAGRGNTPAITSLAVMAFLSAGHVPGEGPYGKTVEKGVRAVLRMQHGNGLLAADGHSEMYNHGICTLMLAEVAGMTQGPLAAEVKKKLERAVVIILLAQRKGSSVNDRFRGGWRYRVYGTDADMSVTGWQLMALRAAKNLGCDVPPESIERAVEYIKRSQDRFTGGFCYQPHGGVTVPCTGTGILALEICGKGEHHSREVMRAGNYLLRNPPRWGSGSFFFYSLYYCSQAAFQLGGNYWEFFRPHLHKALLDNQTSTGAWNDSQFGPAYGTSMGVLAMTVEYRFLPIYQRGEEPTDKK